MHDVIMNLHKFALYLDYTFKPGCKFACVYNKWPDKLFGFSFMVLWKTIYHFK